MNNGNNLTQSWALLFARAVLGLIFFMVGVYKVFQMGPLEHAHKLFVEPYSNTFLPTWILWFVGAIIPFIELVAGFFVIFGFRTRNAFISLGFVLVTVTFGHLLKEPFYEFHTGAFQNCLPKVDLAEILFYLG